VQVKPRLRGSRGLAPLGRQGNVFDATPTFHVEPILGRLPDDSTRLRAGKIAQTSDDTAYQ
jgi:hypothetical protein